MVTVIHKKYIIFYNMVHISAILQNILTSLLHWDVFLFSDRGNTTRAIRQVHGRAQHEADAVLFLHQQTSIDHMNGKKYSVSWNMTLKFMPLQLEIKCTNYLMTGKVNIAKCVQFKLYIACMNTKKNIKLHPLQSGHLTE